MVIGRTSASALSALLLASIALTGCSSDEKKDENKAGETQSQSAGATTGAPSINTDAISPPDLVNPPTMKTGFEGARKDVTLDKCEAKEGPQTVKGKIKSSAKAKADYLVTINWVNGSDVMGRGFALVRDVEPGKETEFEVKADIKRKNTACTVNVVRGTVNEESLKSTAPVVPTAKPAATATATK